MTKPLRCGIRQDAQRIANDDTAVPEICFPRADNLHHLSFPVKQLV
jgi:hypothetical protein